MENRERNSATECRAGGRTGRESGGVVCDRKMNVKTKGEMYRTVVRLALVHGGRNMKNDGGRVKEII